MYNLDIKGNGHNWEKLNLVTLHSPHGGYDLLKCTKCGIKGKTFTLGIVRVKESYKKETVFNCTGVSKNEIPIKVKVTFCQAQGRAFSNILPGTIHDVVEPPKGYKNDHSGLWVMGNGEPIKLLPDEFTIEK